MKIKLGDEVIDVTSKVEGVAIGRVEYLSGAVYWIIQPYAGDDNIAPRELYIPEAYAKRKGDGVYVKPKPDPGFHV
jgi:hypothetical protein